MIETKKKAPVLAVINMKGGVGKTTLSGNLCREIFRGHSISTLLIDFDPQINLSQLLLTRSHYETLRSSKRTLWNVLEPESETSVFHTSVSDNYDIGDAGNYIITLKYLTPEPEIKLDLLAGDFRLTMLNLREGPDSLKLARKRFEDLIGKSRLKYDLVVLDCNPSSSFLTRCAIESATHLLIPVRPDRYSILGLEMLMEYTKQLPTLSSQPDPVIVFNGVSGHTSIEGEIRAHEFYGPKTLVTTIPLSDVLHARADYTGFAVDRKVSYKTRMRNTLKKAAGEVATRLRLKK